MAQFLSIVSDGTPANTRITVVDPETGKEIEVDGVVELSVEANPKGPVFAFIKLAPKALTLEVSGRAARWETTCPVCSESHTHECSTPDFASVASAAAAAIKPPFTFKGVATGLTPPVSSGSPVGGSPFGTLPKAPTASRTPPP